MTAFFGALGATGAEYADIEPVCLPQFAISFPTKVAATIPLLEERWTLNNLTGSTKRAVGVAFMIAMGNTGGVIACLVFVGSEIPRYQTLGHKSGFHMCGYYLHGHAGDCVQAYQQEAGQGVAGGSRGFSTEKLEEMGDRSSGTRSDLEGQVVSSSVKRNLFFSQS
ncbi:hypothetical protein IMZ48_37105 [Candidatus Bathyarchaeota archaeon]|nr:hypothetical protein [Candidatus Bathyarchaeota archaeon]